MESTHFNLKLKQKDIENHFNFYSIGSIKNNNFKNKTNYIGSSIESFLFLIEGIHSICQNLKNKNSLIIINSEFFKRKNNNINIILFLKLIQKFCNVSVLNSCFYETGVYSITNYLNLNIHNFIHYSAIYFINVVILGNKLLNKLFYASLNSINETVR